MPYTQTHGCPSPPVTPVSIVVGWPGEKGEIKEQKDFDLCKSVAVGVEECYSEISRQMQMLSLIEEKIVSLSAPALGLLNVLSLLSPNDIPELLLNQQLPSDGVLQYPVSAPMYIIARDELFQTGLAKWRWTDDAFHLAIESDVQDANQCTITSEEYQDSFDTVVLLLSRSLPRIVDESLRFTISQEEREQFAKLLPYIMTLHKRFSETQLWHPPVHIKRDLVWLYQRTAWFLCPEQEHDTAKTLLELALAIAEDHYYDMIDLQADILYCLARCGVETNMRPKQILSYSVEYLELCEDMDDGSPLRQIDLSNAHANIAQAYLLLDNHESALKASRKSQNILRLMEVDDSPFQPSHFARILEGWALAGLDRHEEAAEILHTAIAFHEETIDLQSRPSIEFALAHQALATVLTSLHQRQAAYTTLKTAHSTFRELLGEGDFHTGQVCLKLAEHHAHIAQEEINSDSYAHYVRERESARGYFVRAQKAFQASGNHKPELARATWKQWKFEKDLPNDGPPSLPASPRDGKMGKGKTVELWEKARELFGEVIGKGKMCDDRVLTDGDFDGIVRFWSR